MFQIQDCLPNYTTCTIIFFEVKHLKPIGNYMYRTIRHNMHSAKALKC